MDLGSNRQYSKRIKEYFIEFFMLFAAVTLGFFAENFREKMIESQNEREYMQTMIEDLKEDTARISASIKSTERKVQGIDSLIRYIYKKPYSDSDRRMMYYLYRRYMGSATDVAFSKRTINQLINSGNLRIIKNMLISDSIVLYDINTERTIRQYSVYHDQYQQKAREISNKIFDSYYLVDYNRENVASLLETTISPKFLDDDEKLLKEYANSIYGGKGVLAIYVLILKSQYTQAVNIIELLNKEYDLK
jgi:hypothetical protein